MNSCVILDDSSGIYIRRVAGNLHAFTIFCVWGVRLGLSYCRAFTVTVACYLTVWYALPVNALSCSDDGFC